MSSKDNGELYVVESDSKKIMLASSDKPGLIVLYYHFTRSFWIQSKEAEGPNRHSGARTCNDLVT